MSARSGLQRVAVAPDQPDPVSGVEKCASRRRADAAAGTRDDDGFCHVYGPFPGKIIKTGTGAVYAATGQRLASAAAFFYLLGRR